MLRACDFKWLRCNFLQFVADLRAFSKFLSVSSVRIDSAAVETSWAAGNAAQVKGRFSFPSRFISPHSPFLGIPPAHSAAWNLSLRRPFDLSVITAPIPDAFLWGVELSGGAETHTPTHNPSRSHSRHFMLEKTSHQSRNMLVLDLNFIHPLFKHIISDALSLLLSLTRSHVLNGHPASPSNLLTTAACATSRVPPSQLTLAIKQTLYLCRRVRCAAAIHISRPAYVRSDIRLHYARDSWQSPSRIRYACDSEDVSRQAGLSRKWGREENMQGGTFLPPHPALFLCTPPPSTRPGVLYSKL